MKEFPFNPTITETSKKSVIIPVVDERHVILLLRNNKTIVKSIDIDPKITSIKTSEFSNCVVVMGYYTTMIVDINDSLNIYWSCESKNIVSISPDTKF